MDSELKACPHCASNDVEGRESITDYYVVCCNCGARTGLVYLGASDAANAAKKAEAILAWNTRAPDAKAETVAEIVAMVRAIGTTLLTLDQLATAIEERFGQ